MVDNVIAVRGVSKAFAGVQALTDISIEIAPGEIHCLAGENGSGKSTLIKVISGVHSPDAGVIELNGREFTQLSPMDAIANGVQVIYQDFSVFPNLSVMENLALTSELAERRTFVNWRRMRRIAADALAKIDVQIDLDEKVERLPVAQKQLIAIARALMSDARLIIMDEPTTALTRREVAALFRIILDLKSRGIATLFVSHKLEEVFEICERFTIIRNGKHVITCLPEELDHRSFSAYMTGREFEETRFLAETRTAEPVLETIGLTLEGGFTGVDLTLRPGEILGITGLLGSGRTELALALFGALQPDAGAIHIDGAPVHLHGVRDAIGHGIGYVPEDRLTEGLFLERSIGSNIVISEIDAFVSKWGVFDQRRARAEAQRWIEDLRIATPNPENAASTLSGGNQQRIVLAKWLATKPRVLILNGPTVGVDIGSKHDIHRVLRELAAEGLAVIIISDDIPEVLHNCSRVLVMNAGRIVAEIDPAATNDAELTALMTQDATLQQEEH
ncbi:sugar ABC transporter ATP-binding protein [Microbacterium sp. zg.Y625]|uniref:sugar ABC transporter ATP-binding protein n=1 Tax=Microbacterium jiangjiandongii TaxID=3049071 RepID=UPI00214BE139|nr:MULTISPECIES: sugar ABC transporter ATP-binding protein [unclassified Microbacterium]MCR2792296.1 sugar ABC transporter ATP-binding protein [Microbacterium sp. zg.Y625]WIM25092.1 sugar ABC transporter ATP-binding protein [Microbacterium sp. zg-Y625]